MKLPCWLEWLPLGSVPLIKPSALPCSAGELAEHYHLIDVRTPAEWQQSHIKGSVNLPLHRFSIKHTLCSDLNKPVICICLSAHRSTPAVRKLRRAGIEAYELKGGMLNWWRLKLPTE
ncbi:MAG: rhodanese-like domain-containing protein [Pontibacterium sp.]